MTGLRRYVHIAFAVAGLLAAYVLSNFFELLGGALGFSYPILGVSLWSVLAFLVAGVVAFSFWRNERSFAFIEECAQELKKVHWPTYEEVRSATLVVIGMVTLFSLILGLFDFFWSGLTNYLVQSLS
jgi:preprotein translocase subunit SecE